MIEFRLNKIDPDLRRKIKETTKADRVHSKKDINIYDNGFSEAYKDSEHKYSEHKYREEDFDEDATRKKVTIDAIKGQTIQVEVIKEPTIHEKTNCRGVFIDTKK